MESYQVSQHAMKHVDSASEHFLLHGNQMEILPGGEGKFDYSKRICMLGHSFVGCSVSASGWGYLVRNEIDGFLISIPHSGSLQWRSTSGRFNAEAGSVILTDQREIKTARYSAGVTYTSVYISNSDVYKCMALLLGRPPKTRVVFLSNSGELWVAQFIVSAVDNIIRYGAHSSTPIQSVMQALKEGLIMFILHSFKNNYSQVLNDPKTIVQPSPHSIKIAAELMSNNYDPGLTISEVAIHAGLSIRALQLGFRRFKDTTPIAFLRSARLNKARTMLLASDCTNTSKEISELCGFSNYYLFCRYYSKTFFEHPNTTLAKSSDPTVLEDTPRASRWLN
ncbi:AraC-type DNA-binding protein [Pseudomonas cuatrocienegasensis]|uniref:AraC-type DNA-binding protein n=1 Tax=Pseudomonas cuatrocienegasensis TaxID=543360 RepID=A0ABY1BL39_9PSED|nr:MULTISPECIES: helix-turn-helix domain-containing protein [Pseudomonas]SER07646.1 AraC-type DNA-binding protein [Pseudomonas cuatrocienegasensis]